MALGFLRVHELQAASLPQEHRGFWSVPASSNLLPQRAESLIKAHTLKKNCFSNLCNRFSLKLQNILLPGAFFPRNSSTVWLKINKIKQKPSLGQMKHSCVQLKFGEV